MWQLVFNDELFVFLCDKIIHCAMVLSVGTMYIIMSCVMKNEKNLFLVIVNNKVED